ncbi:hypothetical protein GALL_395380 [mine drainage metagenome]|uniref:Uncharacterized protein n=1 Tax=mine drainage metagenome TaxID=410659 RepID=A0A1J5QFI4_9ZZZZ
MPPHQLDDVGALLSAGVGSAPGCRAPARGLPRSWVRSTPRHAAGSASRRPSPVRCTACRGVSGRGTDSRPCARPCAAAAGRGRFLGRRRQRSPGWPDPRRASAVGQPPCCVQAKQGTPGGAARRPGARCLAWRALAGISWLGLHVIARGGGKLDAIVCSASAAVRARGARKSAI